jgi:RNA polymerase sigma-70 factor (ECF subfamily)
VVTWIDFVPTSELDALANDRSPLRSQADAAAVRAPDFRAIYDGHFDFVWRSLRRLGVHEADAKDLTQKVFLTVHLRLADFEGRSELRTWIFGICLRVASDYRRSAAVRREVVTDAAQIASHESGERDPLSVAESRSTALVAEAVVNKLPEAQRIVFVLFELEEMSAEQIADLVEAPVGTVRSRLRLARETFRREAKRIAAAKTLGRKEAV